MRGFQSTRTFQSPLHFQVGHRLHPHPGMDLTEGGTVNVDNVFFPISIDLITTLPPYLLLQTKHFTSDPVCAVVSLFFVGPWRRW